MRKQQIIVLMAASAAIMLAPAAWCDYAGLFVVREFANQQTAAGIRDVYRVYAEFTNPADRVDTWYGTQSQPFVIQNVLADGQTLGAGFTNFGGAGGVLPPEIDGTIRDWDTYATIGVTWLNENGTQKSLAVSPGFPVFISGASLTAEGSVFLTDLNAPQGTGGFRVNGQDTDLRVLLMQLTIMPGQHVRGRINLDGRIQSDSGYVSFTATEQTFQSIPAPTSLIALALLAYCRRRKRCSI